jgi:hypothetical protein
MENNRRMNQAGVHVNITTKPSVQQLYTNKKSSKCGENKAIVK